MEKMNTVRVNAYAKLNLTLDLVGREGEYHLIDSLVTTVDLFDRVVVKKRKDGLISVRMHGMGSESIPPEENNAQRAGEAFVSAFGTAGADITVYKNIPMGAGMGGSSADAAGVLKAMAKLYEIQDAPSLKAVADGLGSDTGYLLTGGAARMRGRGDLIEPLPAFPQMNFLALCPKEGVSTRECYSKSDGTERGAPHTQRAIDCLGSNPEWAAKLFYNDLYTAAKELLPAVEEALGALKALSPWGASMTGSGSAVFAAFETRELCEWAKSRYRGKCRAYVLRSTDGKERGIRSPYSAEE